MISRSRSCRKAASRIGSSPALSFQMQKPLDKTKKMKTEPSNHLPQKCVVHPIKQGALLLAVLLVMTQVADAGSATWNLNPTNGDWFTAANWTPQTVPNGKTDTATFGVSNTTAVICRATAQLAGITFGPGASPYTITIRRKFSFSGVGVLNNSGIAQQFSLPIDASSLSFRKSAGAGSAIFSVQGADLFFYDDATAGDASFTMAGLGSDAVTEFHDASTAGAAAFFNRSGANGAGATNFYDTSTADTATFTCEGGSTGTSHSGSGSFNNESSASYGTFVADAASSTGGVGGSVDFHDDSTANNATLTANGAKVQGAYGGSIVFDGNQTTAGMSILIANGGTNGGLGGTISFAGGSQGGSSQVQLSGNGQLDVSSHNAPGVSIGSLDGDGEVVLGSNNLTVGRNNRDTSFAGLIDGQAGGSLTKTGSGQFSVVGANTYTGPTIVEAGYLLISNQVGSATGTGPIIVNGGTFGGQGGVVGPVTVGTGTGFEPYLEPGARGVTGRLLIQRELTFNSDGELQWQVDSDRVTSDHVVSNGLTIIGDAEIHFGDFGNSVIPVGTVFTMFSNTAATPINGEFEEMPDGGTVTIGSNTFQANYEGGDGNDLTLTVVP